MIVWAFVLVLNLTSFDGEVRVIVETTTQESCWKLRQTVLREFGGEGNFKGVATPCEEKPRG